MPCARLEAAVWPNPELAARIARDYVPVQIRDDADMAAVKLYEVQVIPTLVIAEADGTLLLKQVGPPFKTPVEAVAWFDGIPGKLRTLASAEAAARDKPEDFFAQLDLWRACQTLGRAAGAAAAMEAAEKLAGDDPGRKLEIDIARLCVLCAQMKHRGAKELAPRVAEALLEKKDPRLPELGLLVADVYMHTGQHAEVREFAAKVLAFSPQDPRHTEYKLRAAYAAYRAGQKDTARTELEALVKAGPEDDLSVLTAREMLKHAFKE